MYRKVEIIEIGDRIDSEERDVLNVKIRLILARKDIEGQIKQTDRDLKALRSLRRDRAGLIRINRQLMWINRLIRWIGGETP